jgi:UDP-N-acetylglucosamine--N-acetylmuramyl-(pentapeptide) pyrophosphoryl-undecaprenol N-acetylglucosamine transferase
MSRNNMPMLNNVILTTGGTGGHIFPALAVAEEIRRRNPSARVTFIGGDYGPERRLATENGLEFISLPVRGVLGRGLRSIAAVLGLGRAVLSARGLLSSIRPQVVCGFGGYAGFPAVMAAALSGVPSALHEQNSWPGGANRLLSRFVRKVMVSFPDETKHFPAAKTVHTGNPVRQAIADAEKGPAHTGPLRLLIFGGSQGATAINKAIVDSLDAFSKAGIKLRHQTGANDLDTVRAAYAEHGLNTDAVHPFIDDMAEAYAWADLVMCRSGATTIAELAVAGKASVLVPFPFATHDHQTANAHFLEGKRAAILLPQTELADRAARVVLDLAQNRDRLDDMAKQADAQGRPDAVAQVVDELQSIARAAASDSGRAS